jgi:hypothetical protein
MFISVANVTVGLESCLYGVYGAENVVVVLTAVVKRDV